MEYKIEYRQPSFIGLTRYDVGEILIRVEAIEFIEQGDGCSYIYLNHAELTVHESLTEIIKAISGKDLK